MKCSATCLNPTPSQAHCPTCHRTFSGVAGFDRHRRGGQCIDPATLGMAPNARGVWRRPASDAERSRLTALHAGYGPGGSESA